MSSPDLEEFLRMAAARRRAAQQRAGRPVEPPLLDVEVIEEAEVIQPLKPSVQPSIDTRDIADHVSDLGKRISTASRKLDAKIHKKFDHDVGRLDHADEPTDQSLEEPTVKRPAPSILATLFSNRESIRKAIIMREILERPKFD